MKALYIVKLSEFALWRAVSVRVIAPSPQYMKKNTKIFVGVYIVRSKGFKKSFFTSQFCFEGIHKSSKAPYQ